MISGNRLRHTDAGYRRLIQISQAELVVIVEGRLDRFFYYELCHLALERHGVRFDVRMVTELPVSTGGKPGVLEFYDRMRSRKQLVDDFKGKRSAVIFILDKDVDDILRCKRRSPHVIYTEVYEVENYLFLHGDVVRCLSASLRLPRAWVEPLLPTDWRITAAQAWRAWVNLCVSVQLLRISASSNYRVPSRVNAPCCAPTDTMELERRFQELKARSGLATSKFESVIARATSAVERAYSAGDIDRVFRGKWYLVFLHFWTAGSGSNFGDDELIAALLASLDFHAAWTTALIQAIEDGVRAANLIAA